MDKLLPNKMALLYYSNRIVLEKRGNNNMNIFYLLATVLAMLISSNTSYAANATSNSYLQLYPLDYIPQPEGQKKPPKKAPTFAEQQAATQQTYAKVQSLTASLQAISKKPELNAPLNAMLKADKQTLQTIKDVKIRTAYMGGYTDIVQELASIIGVKVDKTVTTLTFPPSQIPIYSLPSFAKKTGPIRLNPTEQDLYNWIQKTVAPALATLDKNPQLQEIISALFQTNKDILQNVDDQRGTTHVASYLGMVQKAADIMGFIIDEQSGAITSQAMIDQKIADEDLKAALKR